MAPVLAFVARDGLQDYSTRAGLIDQIVKYKESVIEKVGQQASRESSNPNKNYFYVLLAGLASDYGQLLALEAGAFLVVSVENSFRFYKRLQRHFPDLHFAYIRAVDVAGEARYSIYTVLDVQHDRYSAEATRRAVRLAK